MVLGVLPSPPVASRALLGLLPDEFVQGMVHLGPSLGIALGEGPGISEEVSQGRGRGELLGGAA